MNTPPHSFNLADNVLSVALDERMQAANRSPALLIKLFRSKVLSRSCKLAL